MEGAGSLWESGEPEMRVDSIDRSSYEILIQDIEDGPSRVEAATWMVGREHGYGMLEFMLFCKGRRKVVLRIYLL